ncbi:hypothetical protein D9M72_439030 [compost metagenome]
MFRKGAEDGEQPLDIGQGQGGGGFIQEQDPGVLVQGLGQLHGLLFRCGVTSHGAADIEMETYAVQRGPGFGLHALPVDGGPRPSRQLAKEDILRHRKGRHER